MVKEKRKRNNPSPSEGATAEQGKEIVRQNKISWHCPICDFAMQIKLKQCAKCGALRKGNKVYNYGGQ